MPKLSVPGSLESTRRSGTVCDLSSELSSPEAEEISTATPQKLSDELPRCSSDLRAPRSAHMSSESADFKSCSTDSMPFLQSPSSERSPITRLKDSVPSLEPLWSTPILLKPSSPVSTRLEELLHDCFTAAVNRENLYSDRLTVVHDFHKYLQELHCHENLEFIIEIFKYEYFYETIYGTRSEKETSGDLGRLRSLNSAFLNLLLEHSIGHLPHPTTSMREAVRSNSLRCRGGQSFNSPDPFPLDFDEPAGVTEDWDDLYDCDISGESESKRDTDDNEGHSSSRESWNDSLLADQWSYILCNFIMPISPSQVNLSEKTADHILKGNSMTADNVHHPLVFRTARSEVVLIIRENVFDSFIRKENLDEGNLFDRLYASSVPALVMASPLGLPPQASSSSTLYTPESKRTTTTSRKNCMVPQKSAETAQAIPGLRSEPAVVAPMPSKRRPKFFTALGNSSSSDGLPSPSGSFTGFLGQFKDPTISGSGRMVYPAPHSPSPSNAGSSVVTPSSLLDIEDLPRSESSASNGRQSPSILGMLWRKKK